MLWEDVWHGKKLESKQGQIKTFEGKDRERKGCFLWGINTHSTMGYYYLALYALVKGSALPFCFLFLRGTTTPMALFLSFGGGKAAVLAVFFFFLGGKRGFPASAKWMFLFVLPSNSLCSFTAVTSTWCIEPTNPSTFSPRSSILAFVLVLLVSKRANSALTHHLVVTVTWLLEC